ncbi:MAG: hypothetical protein FGM46_00530 [Ferruginibacter sp.]|nr:hypothetical protein [Ferruginibacter sp.]
MSLSSEEILQQLNKENEDLKFELNDLRYLIQLKEEELNDLHAASKKMGEMQSKLENNITEIETMRRQIEEAEQKNIKANRREAALEEELIQSIAIEKSYYEIKEKYLSTQTALEDAYHDLNDLSKLYKEISEMKKRLTEVESKLELTLLDNTFLKEQLHNPETNSTDPKVKS